MPRQDTEEAGWPENLPQMKVIDDLLRCGICFDYYNIAMIIPQCSHNYCSLCIRKFLSYKTQCPTCCVSVVEPDLRNNRLLDELVKNFHSARHQLLQFVLDSPPLSPTMRWKNDSSGKPHSARSMGCSRNKQESSCMDNFFQKANRLKPKRTKGHAREESEVGKIEGECSAVETDRTLMELISSGSTSNAESPRDVSTPAMKEVQKVDCPVCGVGIPEQYINRHLDSCLTSDEKKESLRSSIQKRKPMAKVVYNLLSERDLRKKLKDVGLSNRGPKQQLIKRHQEFVHMFNSQCDSLNPKSAAEIIKEIEDNEKARAQLQTKPGENSLTFTKDQSEQEIEGIHNDYRQKHKNEFQFLVDQVKNRCRTSVKKELKEGEDLSKHPTRLEDDTGEECSVVLSVLDLASHSNMEDEVGAHQSEDTILINCEQKILTPDVNVHGGEVDLSPDVVNEGGADEHLAKGTPYRSESPSFPLTPRSPASSSSDILRDLEEVQTDASTDFLPEVQVRKRKSKSKRPQEGGTPTTARSKRSRK